MKLLQKKKIVTKDGEIKMTRKEKRKQKGELKIFNDVVQIMEQYFPELVMRMEKLTDERHQSYVEYNMSTIGITRLAGLLCGIKSMRETTEELNTGASIKNIGKLVGKELEEIPHYDTINNVFEKIKIEELEKIQKYMVTRLIRSKMFEKYKYKGIYYQVVIDGTGLVKYKQKEDENCLIKTYNKGTTEEYKIYYRYVLEAKLVVGEMVISIGTEFVENEDEEIGKQDCELKAFYRLAKKLKKEYPKLPIIITGDALYACDKVIEICKENKWEYILRQKDRIKSLSHGIRMWEADEKEEAEIKYCNEIGYGGYKLEKRTNVIKYYQKNEKTEETAEYLWITSLKITEKNKKEIVYYGRQRWRIENEGFNIQKNGTFDIERIYSRNYNALKAHYFFIQFAHTIRQLLEKGMKYIRELKMSIKEVSATIKEALTHTVINLAETSKIQLRFDTT